MSDRANPTNGMTPIQMAQEANSGAEYIRKQLAENADVEDLLILFDKPTFEGAMRILDRGNQAPVVDALMVDYDPHDDRPEVALTPSQASAFAAALDEAVKWLVHDATKNPLKR